MSSQSHIQEDCDTWLSTTRRKKVVKSKSTKKRLSAITSKKTPFYRLEITQTDIEIKATKQTSVTSFFKTRASDIANQQENEINKNDSQNLTLNSSQDTGLKQYLDLQSSAVIDNEEDSNVSNLNRPLSNMVNNENCDNRGTIDVKEVVQGEYTETLDSKTIDSTTKYLSFKKAKHLESKSDLAKFTFGKIEDIKNVFSNAKNCELKYESKKEKCKNKDHACNNQCEHTGNFPKSSADIRKSILNVIESDDYSFDRKFSLHQKKNDKVFREHRSKSCVSENSCTETTHSDKDIIDNRVLKENMCVKSFESQACDENSLRLGTEMLENTKSILRNVSMKEAVKKGHLEFEKTRNRSILQDTVNTIDLFDDFLPEYAYTFNNLHKDRSFQRRNELTHQIKRKRDNYLNDEIAFEFSQCLKEEERKRRRKTIHEIRC